MDFHAMRMIAFVRPDNKLIWVNPESVIYVTESLEYSGMVMAEIATQQGKIAVKGEVDQIAAQLGEHIQA